MIRFRKELWAQLVQLVRNDRQQRPTWDGNLISKTARTRLVRAGLADQHKGYNFPTLDGIRMYNIFAATET